MAAEVYWIRAQHHSDITSEGYVGVSKNSQKRWLYGHKWSHSKARHDNQHLSSAINKYGWDLLVKTVVLIGEETYCYEIERKLRPSEGIGWNLSVGGHKPPITKFRGETYISPLKGISRPTPWLVGVAKPPSKEACAAGGRAAKGRKNTPEHLEKRMASRRVTRISRGQIKSLMVNGVKYESSKVASVAVEIPESTLKYWAYGRGKIGPKYAHITECRWIQ
jgi:hypothetical protein